MESNKPQQRLRIAIEAQRIFRPHKHGMDVVALEMIREIQRLDTYNEYFILVKKDKDVCLEETDNFKIIYLEGRSYPGWEQVSLLKWVRRNKPDILHCTSNTAPIIGSYKLFLTLHDVIFIEKNYLLSKKGGSSYQRFGNFYRSIIAPRAARKAKIIFTVSDYQKQQIIKFLGVPNEKVNVVYNGVSNDFFTKASPKLREEVENSYNLPDRYIFYFGNTDPRKNLIGVLKSYDKLRHRIPDAPMLLIKGISEEYLYKILAEYEMQELFEFIKLVEYIKSAHLPVIYQMSEMLVFPSLSEGFGIPIIEAMASGIPVITSNVTSMPEVAGDAALLVDPTSTDEIAFAMKKVLTDSELRKELIAKGLKRAQDFTWERLAKTVINSYLAN